MKHILLRAKKILKAKDGVALITVLGIIGVITVLATGAFYFSQNELGFSGNEVGISQAQYLARSGIQVAARTFPDTAGKFDLTNSEPVTGTMYWVKTTDASGATASKLLTLTDSAAAAADVQGKVTVTVTQAKRSISTEATAGGVQTTELDVWYYTSVAEVGNMRATAKGYTLPMAYGAATQDSADDALLLDWITPQTGTGTKTGIIKTPATLNDSATSSGAITAIIDRIFGTSIGTVNVYSTDYYGTVVIGSADYDRLILPQDNNKKIVLWAAPSIIIEPKIDFRGAQSVKGLAIAGNTIVFENDIHLYANGLGQSVGDLTLQSLSGEGRVYFKGTVYLHKSGFLSSSNTILFPAGSAFTFSDEKAISLIKYGVDTREELKNFLGLGSGSTYYDGSELVAMTEFNPPSQNSLSQIVWE